MVLMLGAAHDPVGPLLGRDAETALITSLLDGVRRVGAALVLRGEPGIGKSRLLTEAAALARNRRMTILSTTGVQSEARLAFSGLHQLIRPVRALAAALPPAPRAALDAALGIGDVAVPEHFRVAMAVLDLLSDVAAEAPLLVLVEDAHWLDRASSDVLAFVARRLESDPVVMLVATRDGSRAALGDAGLPELRLEALDPAVAAKLIDASAPDLTTVVRDRLLSEAAGNPLALIELPVAAARLEPGSPMPGLLPLTERLERAFAARVSELPDDTRLLLLIAALNDGEDPGEVLRGAGAIAGKTMNLDALEPAVRSAIVDLDVRTVHFRHPLMRSAVRQDATVRERRRGHEALAGMLDAEPDRRVWHRAALISVADEDVAADLAEAGRRARRRGATGEAFAALRRAAELSEPAQRGARLLDAAQLAHELGQPEAVLPLLREVEQLGPGTCDRARATWIEETVDPRPLTDTARATALITAAESAGEAGDRDLHIDLLWLVAVRAWWTDPGPAVRQLLVEASRRLGDADAPDPRVSAIYAYADSLGHAPAVLARLRALAAEGCRDTDAARYFSDAAFVVGAFDLAMTFLDTAVEGLRAEGRLGHLPRTLALHGFVAARLADWDVAIPAAEESRRLGAEFGEALAEARADNIVSMIAGMRGDADAAEQASTNAERVGLSTGAHATVTFAQCGRVLSALGAGRHADAYRFTERLFDPAHPAHHPVVACWHIGDLAEAAVHVDRVEQARARVAQVEAAAGDNPSIWIALGLRHARAMLADGEHDAAERYDEALSADLGRWPFQRARILLAHGEWLRRQRRIAESRAPLRTARDTFDALSCVDWGNRARRELRASGESSRRRDPAARDRLTAQELQIAQLAAEGLSNREIGARLYLSPRTISTHLYHVFPKLAITARSQLAMALSPAMELTR
jgi:DNA-binding CsgD family transcriptional regulator